MKSYQGLIIITLILSVTAGANFSLAETATTTEAMQAKVQFLTNQIKDLQAQVANLQAGQIIKINKTLYLGLFGEEVKLLQQILKTDPEIYPEGLITGFYGPKTEKAVKRLQKKLGIADVGIVGPQTRAKLNELLVVGAGNSGQVPPGLLIAPGIQNKFANFNFTPLPGQALPPSIAKKLNTDNTSTTTDTIAPIITDINAASTTASSTHIIWQTNESTSGTVWYDTTTPIDIAGSVIPKISISSLSTAHEVLINNLLASTTYHFVIEAKDISSNTATSSAQSFTTLSAPAN